jgi:hypothetical protein
MGSTAQSDHHRAPDRPHAQRSFHYCLAATHKMISHADKICAHCGGPIRYADHPTVWKRIKYCGTECGHAAVRITPEKALAAFWANVDKGGPGGCWLWKSYRNERGYGLMHWHGRKNVRAHRFSWELVNGATPSDRFCLHKCDVRHCVNPDHLFLGSYAENAADMAAKGRSVWGTRSIHAKLTEDQVRYIRANYRKTSARKGNGSKIARELGVSPGMVHKIGRGESWRQLP